MRPLPEEFGMDTSEAETSADLEEAATEYVSLLNKRPK